MEFTDLIKIVHPDHHQESRFASHERAVEAIKNRSNPQKLKKLAIEWGILPRPKPWTVKKRGLKVGDVVTFTKGPRSRILTQGLIVKVYEIKKGRHKNKYAADIVDLNGIEWTIRSDMIQKYDLRFKCVCQDKTLYTLEDIMQPLGLEPNKQYKDKYLYYRNTRCEVYKTSYTRVFLINKFGLISVNPKALKLKSIRRCHATKTTATL